jgi:hypothetical protein
MHAWIACASVICMEDDSDTDTLCSCRNMLSHDEISEISGRCTKAAHTKSHADTHAVILRFSVWASDDDTRNIVFELSKRVYACILHVITLSVTRTRVDVFCLLRHVIKNKNMAYAKYCQGFRER